MSDRELIDRLRKFSLIEVADKLGLATVKRGSRTWTNCLFHKDRSPSMAFSQTVSGDWGFKCFSCGAHGDVFSLIRKVNDCDFHLALEKVAAFAGESLPRPKRGKKVSISGLQIAQRCYDDQNAEEKRNLKIWAEQRSFTLATLKDFSIVFARNQKLSTLINDREQAEALRDAALIYKPNYSNRVQPDLDIDVPDSDAMLGERIIFPVRDFHGGVQGFFGRAFHSEQQPRYQFTRHFPKSKVLFGLDVARKSLKLKSSTSDNKHEFPELQLCIVEGATDVLRLHQQGIESVAVMGSDLSVDQAILIERLARELNEDGTSLTLRLFLDGDEAGQTASRRALTKLLVVQAKQALFGVEVVVPTKGENASRGVRRGIRD